jgi:hypothetical protein
MIERFEPVLVANADVPEVPLLKPKLPLPVNEAVGIFSMGGIQGITPVPAKIESALDSDGSNEEAGTFFIAASISSPAFPC